MPKANNAPAVRFVGYKEEWEKRKVGELLTERNEQAPMSDEYPLMAFIAYEGVAPKGERYDRSALVNDTAGKLYKKTELGDFIYSSNNLETGSIGLNNYGKASVSPVYSIFQPTELAYSSFIGNRFTRKDFINAMVKWRQGVIYGQWRIHESDFIKIEVAVPSIEEQEEQRDIGELFCHLDDLIKLHQSKYEKLVKVKKSMLKKMFPQGDAKVPEIRFAGFYDDWEQHELRDTFNFLQNNTLSRADLDSETGVAKNVHYGDVLIKFSEYLDCSKSALPYIPSQWIVDKFKGSLLQDGDVIMADTAEDEAVGKCTEIAEVQGFPTISGLHTIPLRPKKKFAPGYLGYYMNSDSYHNQLLPLMQGIKVTSVSKNAIMDTIISYPTDTEEQAEIGRFFIRLDNIITLHLRKLEKLKQLKASFLEKMFV